MEESADRVVQAYLEAGDAEDYDTLRSLVVPEVVVHSPGDDHTGVDALVEGWAIAHSGLAGLRHEVRVIVGRVDSVAALVLVHGTHTGTFLGLAATGRRLRVDQALFANVHDARIAEMWEVVDTGSGLRQLGALGDQAIGLRES